MQELVIHSGTARGSEIGRRPERSGNDFELAAIYLFEQFAASASSPQLQLCVLEGGDTQHYEVRTQIDAYVPHNTAPTAVKAGQEFLLKVYKAFSSLPDVWAGTVIIVTYDEHGGFYDHRRRNPAAESVRIGKMLFPSSES